jgi:hypothetical protein
VANGGFSDDPSVTRVLLVVGQVRNDSGTDLIGTLMSVAVEGEPVYRSDNTVVGCSGDVPKGGLAPVSFALPLRPGMDETHLDFTVNGIVGARSNGRMAKLPVHDLTVNGFDVSGEVLNNTANWVFIRGACFNAYDGSQLIGTTSTSYAASLAPGERLHVAGNVGGLGTATRNEIVVYGEVMPGPPIQPPSAADSPP